ncbi:MAG: hypothetical protein SV201_03100 [Pseudomonadota bacterium]|nr:hypothetical protein [Pseudomonadota bacterium]
MPSILRYVLLPLCFIALSLPSVQAADRLQLADEAVANILFDYDGSFEFASYKVDENGFVDITFASNTPDSLYSEILNKLESHPEIDGVLSGKGGPTCDLF